MPHNRQDAKRLGVKAFTPRYRRPVAWTAPRHQSGWNGTVPRPGMEPLSLIVAALAAGAAAAAKDTASAAIKDAYQGLKGLVQRKVAGSPAAAVVLEEHAKDPDTYDAPLKKTLIAAAADQDAAILQAARELLERTGAPSAPGPVIRQSIGNVKYAAISGTGDASIGPIHEHGEGPDG